MAKLLFLFVALLSLTYVSATFPSLNIETTSTAEGVQPFANTLSQWIVETVSNKIVSIARFFNLKLRLIRFLVSLWTTENLVLFRNLLEEAVKFGTFVLSFLPQSVDDPLYWWVPAISQFINISVGESGLFGLALGPVTGAGGETTEESSSEISEIVTNPTVFFNVPLSNTEQSTTESNEIFDTRNKRVVIEEREANEEGEEREANEEEKETGSEGKEYTKEEILKKYEENIITLDRLINSRK